MSADVPTGFQHAGTPRVFSGMQPTSDSLHLGNYLGALSQWGPMQDGHEAVFCVVDLHAVTVPMDPALLRERTRRTAAQFMAGGVDPERSVLFVQSHVPEHAELAWLLNCITGFGEASRMTQFKDKAAKQEAGNVSVGLFTYPMLMAADILLYDTSLVPVGDDQVQHVELTRDLAQRFNHRFGDTFVVPEYRVTKESARVMDLQEPTNKMSKSASSDKGVIWLLEEAKASTKKLKSAVTDNDAVIAYDQEAKPGVTNLLNIHAVASGESVETLLARFEGQGYGALKVSTAEAVEALLAPARERAAELLADPAELDRILARGSEKARAMAAPVMDRAREAMGFLPVGRD
ncbi:tryptophan--tRNA ligase [Kytococcus schroeteri]|uniref:Tryptophan--tRNA ligase n=1 Tax=Kytococcus schroeteri TaxID=138300 RepID=A0A2I1P991_9MICO|nr:tryptophan--tRNA ligase [Kytococcus schroeteri]PKZ41152.1 tryptophan--tRNA ligase [Kytococcus schroeteri]